MLGLIPAEFLTDKFSRNCTFYFGQPNNPGKTRFKEVMRFSYTEQAFLPHCQSGLGLKRIHSREKPTSLS